MASLMQDRMRKLDSRGRARLLAAGFLAAVLLVGGVSCGGDSSETQEDSTGASTPATDASGATDPISCASDEAETSVTVDGAQLLPQELGDTPSGPRNGSLTVEAIDVARLPDSFYVPSVDLTVTADNPLVGVRYEVTNDLTTEVMPMTEFALSWRLTDGEQSWPIADYTGDFLEVSDDWSEVSGDADSEDLVGAGLQGISWAVFEVPEDSNPAAVAWPLAAGTQACLALPGEVDTSATPTDPTTTTSGSSGSTGDEDALDLFESLAEESCDLTITPDPASASIVAQSGDEVTIEDAEGTQLIVNVAEAVVYPVGGPNEVIPIMYQNCDAAVFQGAADA